MQGGQFPSTILFLTRLLRKLKNRMLMVELPFRPLNAVSQVTPMKVSRGSAVRVMVQYHNYFVERILRTDIQL